MIGMPSPMTVEIVGDAGCRPGRRLPPGGMPSAPSGVESWSAGPLGQSWTPLALVPAASSNGRLGVVLFRDPCSVGVSDGSALWWLGSASIRLFDLGGPTSTAAVISPTSTAAEDSTANHAACRELRGGLTEAGTSPMLNVHSPRASLPLARSCSGDQPIEGPPCSPRAAVSFIVPNPSPGAQHACRLRGGQDGR